MENKPDNLLAQRRAGVLLHITSLPNEHGAGNMGQEAYNFINFLHDTGVKVWQTLPLGMPHGDGSPYQCLSAHAGNPALICLDDLVHKGWLQKAEQADICELEDTYSLHSCMGKAYTGFKNLASTEEKQALLLPGEENHKKFEHSLSSVEY